MNVGALEDIDAIEDGIGCRQPRAMVLGVCLQVSEGNPKLDGSILCYQLNA